MVEVLGRYSNHCEQGKRIQSILEMKSNRQCRTHTRTIKRVQHRLAPNEIANLIELYHQGKTIDSLAELFQVSRTTVMAHLDRQKVQRRQVGIDPGDLVKVARLYESGWSVARIGKSFGIAGGTVLCKLRELGVEIRPRRGWDKV